jgi:hypothetical protein
VPWLIREPSVCVLWLFFVCRKIEDIEVSGLISSLTGNRDFCLYVTYYTVPVFEYRMIYRGPCRRSCGLLWFGSSATHPPVTSASCLSFSVFLCVAASPIELTDGRCGGGGVRSQIIPRESLVLYKSFDTLWCTPRENLLLMFFRLFHLIISCDLNLAKQIRKFFWPVKE